MRKPKATAKPAPEVETEAEAADVVETTAPNPPASLAAQYDAMTDVQIMEVMHGDPATMLRDVRALVAGLVPAKT